MARKYQTVLVTVASSGMGKDFAHRVFVAPSPLEGRVTIPGHSQPFSGPERTKSAFAAR